ncbi:MAG: DUF4295 family protein [Lewinellaceae bacterium]|nr:DUF4295 family protein [Lewinellaceae bacterium]
MAKVSKNARVAQRAANAGSGRDFVKIVVSVKDPKSGKYSYKEHMIHKDKKDEFLASLK